MDLNGDTMQKREDMHGHTQVGLCTMNDKPSQTPALLGTKGGDACYHCTTDLESGLVGRGVREHGKV